MKENKEKTMFITDTDIAWEGKKYPLASFAEEYYGDSAGYKLTWAQEWVRDIKLKEKLVYEGETLWYLMDYIMEWLCIIVKDAYHFGTALYWIDLAENLMKKKPESVRIWMSDPVKKELIARVMRKHGVHVIEDKKYSPKKRKYNKELLLLKARILMRSKLKTQNQKRPGADAADHADILVFSSDAFSNKDNEKDQVYGNLIKEFNKQEISHQVLVYDRLWYINSWKNILDKVKKTDSTKIFIGNYYDSKVFSDIRKIHAFMKKIWASSSQDEKFKGSVEYKGINFFDIIYNRFSFIFNAFSYELGDCLAITKRVMEERRPKIILIDHEDNFYGKGFMINSKKNNTKVMALEYEQVYRGGVATHIKEKNTKKESLIWRPLPDIKFVGGEFIKKTLIKYCNYPDDGRIRVVGQPRYDAYFQMRKTINQATAKEKTEKKVELKKKSGIPTDKKIITYIASSASYDKGALEFVIDFVNANQDFFLIIKVHPSWTEKEYDDNFKINPTNMIVRRNFDLKELLPITDLLTTVGSTVALEAMIFDIPVMLINSVFPCAVPYVNYNAALSVKNKKEFTVTIARILHDQKTRMRLRNGAARFISEYLGNTDGSAAEKIAKIIKVESNA